MPALLPSLLLLLYAAPPAAAPRQARFVFAWRGVPVGTVTLSLEEGGRRLRYTSEHLLTREGEVGTRRQEALVALEGAGPGAGPGTATIAGSGGVRPQALWLWQGPPAPGCVRAREELSGREGPHCVQRVALGGAGPGALTQVEGTLLGQAFTAAYTPQGQLQALALPGAQFRRVGPRVRLRAPPDLFAQGLGVQGAHGALAFSPSWPLPPAPVALSAWAEAPARALARQVHAALPDKRPSPADLGADGAGEGGAGGCLAHALRFARLAAARGQQVALVHGLVAEEGSARAFPHAWVRVGLADGATLDLDPTSLAEVTPATHLPLALAAPGAGDLEAGERWLSLLAGTHRLVRR